MERCEEAEQLPKKKIYNEVDLLANHQDTTKKSDKCAANHKCLVDWIIAGDK